MATKSLIRYRAPHLRQPPRSLQQPQVPVVALHAPPGVRLAPHTVPTPAPPDQARLVERVRAEFAAYEVATVQAEAAKLVVAVAFPELEL